MAPLTEHDLLSLWEIGSPQHLLDRALTILAFACPETNRSELATLTIGQRDLLLFELREQILGGKIEACVDCPQCCEQLEFSLPPESLQTLSKTQPSDSMFEFMDVQEGVTLTFRLPNSRDLALVVEHPVPAIARTLLAQRCIMKANLDGKPIPTSDLTDTMISGLAARMAECDPAGDMLLDLDCPSCHAKWQQSFDIVSFLWSEISSLAKLLLREVHILAQTYGWGEADILAMSAARRNTYLEMISG